MSDENYFDSILPPRPNGERPARADRLLSANNDRLQCLEGKLDVALAMVKDRDRAIEAREQEMEYMRGQLKEAQAEHMERCLNLKNQLAICQGRLLRLEGPRTAGRKKEAPPAPPRG